MKYYILFCFGIFFTVIYSQQTCENSLAFDKAILSSNGEFSIKVDNKKKSHLAVTFNNPTADTIYIFSSYFEEEYYTSKIINRVNEENKIRKISFLPFVWCITPEKSDAVITHAGGIIRSNQFLYNFISLPPKTSYQKEFIFNNYQEFTEDISMVNAGRTKRIYLKDITIENINEYKNVMEFAVYNNIAGLCDINFYIKYMDNYYEKADSYKLYSVNIGNK